MADLFKRDFRQFGVAFQATVQRGEFIHRHGEHLGIHAGFVFHLEHRQRAAAHYHAGIQRNGRDHQHIHRVAVVGKGVRDIAVVARVVHRGIHEAIDEDRAGFLVHFVFHRFPVHGNLDDHVEVVGQVFPGGDFIQTHYAGPCWVKMKARIVA